MSYSEAALPPLRPTYVEVDLSQIAFNFQVIQEHVYPARVMPVIKANAYGHGMLPVARCLLGCGVEMLAVGILEEGIALRKAGIEIPVLVMGGILSEQVEAYLQYDLILTVTSIENLKVIEKIAQELGKKAVVHIKIDTGMGRLGIPYQEAESLLEFSLKCTHIQVGGIFSHFANSETEDLAYARLQLERFLQVLDFYPKRGLPCPSRHIANSGGILQLPESYLDYVRPGILLYGYYPSREIPQSLQVKPALSWKTRAVLSKILPADHPVSYGSTWQTDHPVRLLTLPVGYGDGYFRSLSNRGQVLVRGRRYPVVGRVCMDQIMVCMENDSAEEGEEVTLLGGSGDQLITAVELAEWSGTIPYEVLTNISSRVPRIYTFCPDSQPQVNHGMV